MSREIRFYENHFIDFYLSLDSSIQEKIEYVFKVIRSVDMIPQKFLKHIEGTDGLYEIRVIVCNDLFRIFCCFEAGRVVILFNGFQKKSQKTPHKEIEKALRLKQSYLMMNRRTNDENN